MASALNISATPGEGEAPENAVPVTLWGAGSGGSATFETVSGEVLDGQQVTLQQLADALLDRMSAVEDRVTALEGGGFNSGEGL